MNRRIAGPGRRLVTLAAAFCMATAGMAPLFASGSERPLRRTPAPERFMEMVDGAGRVVDIQKAAAAATSSSDRPVLTQAQLLEKRSLVVELTKSPHARSADVARRLLSRIDIATATTAAARHSRIRQLPVTISTSRTSVDGRPFTVKTFFAGGKVRLRFFTAVDASAGIPLLAEDGEQSASGPFVDSPTVAESLDDCDLGELEPCTTQQEMEDFAIYAADGLAQAEAEDAAAQAEYGAYVEFCDQNPWACGDDSESVSSGPSACSENCLSRAAQATFSTAGAVGAFAVTVVRINGAFTRGMAMAVAEVGGLTLITVSASFWAGWYVGEAINCYYFYQVPNPGEVFAPDGLVLE